MARRPTPGRLSRGVPYALTETQQKTILKLLESDSIRSDVSDLIGKDLSTLTIQEQIEAFHTYVDSSFGLALIAQATQIRQEIKESARKVRGEREKDEKIRHLEAALEIEKKRREKAEITIDLMDADALAQMTTPRRRA